MSKKIFSLLFAFSIIVTLFNSTMVVHGETINDLKKELAELERQKANVGQEISLTAEEITATENLIAETGKKILRLQKNIAKTMEEIEFLNGEIELRDEEIKNILVYYQMNTIENEAASFLTGQTTFSETQHKGELSSQLSSYNKERIDEMLVLQQQLASKKNALEQEVVQSQELQKTLNDAIIKLNKDLKDFNVENESIDTQIAAARENIKTLEDMGCRANEELDACVERINRPPSGNGFSNPMRTGRMTSEFGYRIHPIFGIPRLHDGIDVAAPTGTNIYAAATGVVYKKYYNDPSIGNAVFIHHTVNGKRYTTAYLHLSAHTVNKGDVVDRETVIGKIGTTGNSTGPHLHFTITSGWRWIDYGASYSHYTARAFNPRNLISFPALGSWF